MTQSNTTTLPNQDLIDGYVGLILKIQPNANIDKIEANVQKKVSGLTGQEPFFLRCVLQSDALSDGDKVGKYIGVYTESDGGDRYPHDYHMSLIRQTQALTTEVI